MRPLQRKIQPEIMPVSIGKIPEPDSFSLSNGVPVYLIEAGSEEIMRIDFIFKAGLIHEDLSLQASTANMMLLEGTQNYNAVTLNRLIDYYGLYLNLLVEKDRAGVIIFFLNRHIEKVLEICQEVFHRSVFPEDELKVLLNKRLQWYHIDRERVRNLAMDQFFESVFGKDHPYGRQVQLQDFNKISPPLLVEFHSKFYSPENMAIIIAGKIHSDTITLLNKYFGIFPSKATVPMEAGNVIKSEKRKKTFIEKKGAVQTAIRLGSTTISKRHPDYPGMLVLNTILGGYFGSRLMKNIREEKGYTYGISSVVSSFELSGYKIIGTEVGKKYTKKALDEIYKEIMLLQTRHVEFVELKVVKNLMLGEIVRMFDGPFAMAESFKSAWEFGLDNNYYYNLAQKIEIIEPDEIMELAKTYYDIDELYEIIAGSR